MDAPCRECGHGRAEHAGGGCSRCTCPAFSGAAGRRSYAPSFREELLALVTDVLTDDERAGFVEAVARARGLEAADAGGLLAQLPHPVCAAYLAELRRRQRLGEPLVR